MKDTDTDTHPSDSDTHAARIAATGRTLRVPHPYTSEASHASSTLEDRERSLRVGARPTIKPPVDRQHEFFCEWLTPDDPAVAVWIKHFVATHTPYTVVRQDFRGVMLYAHRVIPGHTSVHRDRWCCGP